MNRFEVLAVVLTILLSLAAVIMSSYALSDAIGDGAAAPKTLEAVPDVHLAHTTEGQTLLYDGDARMWHNATAMSPTLEYAYSGTTVPAEFSPTGDAAFTGGFSLTRQQNLVILSFLVRPSTTLSSGTTLFTLTEPFRPSTMLNVTSVQASDQSSRFMILFSSGVVSAANGLASGEDYQCSITYLLEE